MPSRLVNPKRVTDQDVSFKNVNGGGGGGRSSNSCSAQQFSFNIKFKSISLKKYVSGKTEPLPTPQINVLISALFLGNAYGPW